MNLFVNVQACREKLCLSRLSLHRAFVFDGLDIIYFVILQSIQWKRIIDLGTVQICQRIIVKHDFVKKLIIRNRILKHHDFRLTAKTLHLVLN